MPTNNSWIRTWENCYSVSLPTLAQKKRRLKELETWAKPTVSIKDDKDQHWIEWSCKKTALKGLIEEQEKRQRLFL